MQFRVERAVANPFRCCQRFVEDRERAVDIAGAGFGKRSGASCAGINKKGPFLASRPFARPILKSSIASMALDRERLKWAGSAPTGVTSGGPEFAPQTSFHIVPVKIPRWLTRWLTRDHDYLVVL